MNYENEKTTTIDSSVDADEGQPLSISNNTIIAENALQSKESFYENEDILAQIRRMNDPSYIHTISMNQLYEETYYSKPPIIDGLLYPGTYLFVGAPKVGKSFLMAQIAYHVSMGLPFWDYQVKKSTVLYLALEDDYKRLQERLYRMFGSDSTENLHFAISAKQLKSGLDEQLQGFVREYPDTRLIIIDTLQKVREVGGDSYSYGNDYDVIAQLKRFTDNSGICLLLVHHTRKQQASDKFNMISGTNGLLGAADGAFMLQKDKRTSNNAVLEVSGRDQQEQCFHLTRDSEKLCWNLEKTETESYKESTDPIIETAATVVSKENPTWVGSPTGLVDKMGVNIKPNVLSLKLNMNATKLLNEYNIRYENIRSHTGRMITLTFVEK